MHIILSNLIKIKIKMTIETIVYGIMDIATLRKIFGDEMTYNELIVLKENQYELKIEYNRIAEIKLVKVWFNNTVVMDKKYSNHYSCDMFYHLNQIELQKKETDEEQETDKDQETDEENKNGELYDGLEEYDDHGVLCRYTEEEGWVAIEDYCVECGYLYEECMCSCCDEN